MKYLNYIKNNIEIIIFGILAILLVYLLIKKNLENFFTEQHGINRLDAIIYINLENRTDRKDLLLKELEKLNTDMSKVHKVCGVFIPKNGHKGCVQSHILALNMIKMNKWKRVLILEDDAELEMPPDAVNNLINQTLDSLDKEHPEWDVIMLGSAYKTIDKTVPAISLDIETLDGPIIPIQIQKLHTATTATSYIVKDRYVDSILNLFGNCNENMKHDKLTGNNFEEWALDQKWMELQRKDNWYVMDKDLFKQRNIWSTTMKESHY